MRRTHKAVAAAVAAALLLTSCSGAGESTGAESDAKAARVIRDNIVTLRAGNVARLITGKVAQVLASPPEGGPFDVVFADPPYAVTDDEVTEVQRALVAHGWLAEDAVVTFERSTRTAVRGAPLTWVDGITSERSRRYGETTLWYGRRS